MAITTTTISKSAGWARTDVVLQLEEAFTWLGWHGGTQTGIVTGISAYSGGGIVGTSNTDYYDVFPATTTGIGTGASFAVYRNNGPVNAIYVNRPGYGYTDGEYVTLSAEDIGGSANGATGIGITVQVAGGVSPVGYGSTNTFYDKDVTAGSLYPWGVVRHTIQSNKNFGNTYRGFQPTSNTQMYIMSGSGFHPWDTTNTSDRGNSYKNRWAGNQYFDIQNQPIGSNLELSSSSLNGANVVQSITFASSNSYQLDLNLYRSGIDPNFAVFAYKQPTLSSTDLSDNNFQVFFFHNFTTPIWDLDYLYLGGATFITPDTNPSSSPGITFNTYLHPDAVPGYGKRSAEWGYSSSGSSIYKTSVYESSSYPNSVIDETTLYYRTAANSLGGQSVTTDTLNSNTFYNAVIKGIPLSTQMMPIPYYLPDDFVLIDFQINTPSVNVQQGDTITISGSEVYTVITGSYNQTTTTRGIAFCARTV
jgi:hypothetical protein